MTDQPSTLNPTELLLAPASATLFFRSRLAQLGTDVSSSELVRSNIRPNGAFSGIYRIHGNRNGQRCQQMWGVTTEALQPSDTHQLYRWELAGEQLWGWQHPADPQLPGLGVACSPELLTALWPKIFPQPPRLEWLTYRPLRRAVLKATTAAGTRYLKVLPLGKAERLAHTHQLCQDHQLSVPELLAPTKAGVLPLASVGGCSLPELVSNHQFNPAHSTEIFHQLQTVLNQLPSALKDLAPRKSWAAGLGSYTKAASRVFPEHHGQLHQFQETISQGLAAADPGPKVAVHGDFHAQNLFFHAPAQANRPPALCGVIDLDRAGPGHRVDDWACLVGHMMVLCSADQGYDEIRALTGSLYRASCAEVGEETMRWHTAAVVVSLIAGAKTQHTKSAAVVAQQRLTAVQAVIEEQPLHWV